MGWIQGGHPSVTKGRQDRMDTLASATLRKADGSTVEAAAALEGKDIILFYFSAHWCPPCRGFTPKLTEFYKGAVGLGVEVVFISADQTEEAMVSYMKESHGDWLAVPFNSELAETLNTKYQVEGIPTLVVVTKDGTVLSEDGDQEVRSMTPAEAIAAWKSKSP